MKKKRRIYYKDFEPRDSRLFPLSFRGATIAREITKIPLYCVEVDEENDEIRIIYKKGGGNDDRSDL